MADTWTGPERRKTERRDVTTNHDGFMIEWKPTALYIAAIVILSASIIATDLHTTEDVKTELSELVTQSCLRAVEVGEANFIVEQASDAAFETTFSRIEKKLDTLVDRLVK